MKPHIIKLIATILFGVALYQNLSQDSLTFELVQKLIP